MFGLSFAQVRDLPRMLFVEFSVEFVDLFPCLFQSFLPGFGQPVDTPPSSAHIHQLGDEKPVPFHAVQEWVERSWTYSIAMMRQFFHHGQAKQGLMSGVKQYMDANQTCEDLPMMFDTGKGYRFPPPSIIVSNFDVMIFNHWRNFPPWSRGSLYA